MGSLATDARFCWAGQGLYGLYRHRLLPGPRKLVGVAKFFLYSAGGDVDLPVLSFLMRFMGYRFQQQTLANTLALDADVTKFGGSTYGLHQDHETARALNFLGFAPTISDFHALADRWHEFILEGIDVAVLFPPGSGEEWALGDAAFSAALCTTLNDARAESG